MCNPIDISVIIPVYGCAQALRELHRRLTDSLGELTPHFEIILVNDSSPDNSWEIIEEICSSNDNVKGIDLSKNFGQQHAITAGFDYSCGNWIVVMDCDLQDPPEEIAELYHKAQEGFDLVIGVSSFRGKQGIFTKLTRTFFLRLFNVASDYEIPGHLGTNSMVFYICSKKIRDNLVRFREHHRYVSILMLNMGFKSTSIEVEHAERTMGSSSYSFMKRLKLATSGLTIYSSLLLKLVRYFGFILSILSFVFGIYILVLKVLGNSFLPGWASIVTLMAFSVGVMILIMGIIGLYIEKIYLEVRRRPLYFVNTELNVDQR